MGAFLFIFIFFVYKVWKYENCSYLCRVNIKTKSYESNPKMVKQGR